MPIPNFQCFMKPILEMAEQGQIRTSEAAAKMVQVFALSDEEIQELLPSGRQTRLANRVYWSFVHLTKAGLLQREARGLYSISESGRQVLADKPEQVDMNLLQKISQNYCLFRRANSHASPVPEEREAETAEERIENAYEDFNNALQSDLYERVLAMKDTDFERLIVKLMLGLGYGAGGLGKRTGGTGDGAIDGIITEDILGLDVIYLQAKRYAPDSTIGPDKIREFAGAMDAHGVVKGVFVTTSRYSKSALEYAERSPKHLRLIDGKELTRLMLQCNVGVRTYMNLELKRLDTDFFDELGE